MDGIFYIAVYIITIYIIVKTFFKKSLRSVGIDLDKIDPFKKKNGEEKENGK